ncbi:MAG: hypothetical protein ERJ68_02595 [Aphanocapsa feldmannii 277cI]|uniref:Uncharacterized protein n=1 Tax=Aphanocapsa feldmannii 277cI TaxID=2507554 RepID=A0A524RUP4_9CHRO|nr:MAG: hypothetical protein ERJ68_02595 [Aphanocapsa feldmannii 277cI]
MQSIIHISSVNMAIKAAALVSAWITAGARIFGEGMILLAAAAVVLIEDIIGRSAPMALPQLPPAKELESKVESMTVPELRTMAQDLGLTNVGGRRTSKARRSDLLAALTMTHC